MKMDREDIVVIGTFLLGAGIFWMVYTKPALLESEGFMGLAVAVVTTGLIQGIVNYRTNAATERTADAVQTLADKVPPRTGEARDASFNRTTGAGVDTGQVASATAAPTVDAEWPFAESDSGDGATGLGEESQR